MEKENERPDKTTRGKNLAHIWTRENVAGPPPFLRKNDPNYKSDVKLCSSQDHDLDREGSSLFRPYLVVITGRAPGISIS